MKRSAFVEWRGSLKEGNGIISTESGSIKNTSYSFGKRFGEDRGTNPEELIAAAHSGCFAMAFSGELDKKNLKAELLEVKAEVTLEKASEGWSIPAVHLIVKARVPGGDYSEVQAAAESAKRGCPVSKLLKADITMDLEVSESQEEHSSMF